MPGLFFELNFLDLTDIFVLATLFFKNLECGLIAGGMRDGVINIFDPAKIMKGDDVPEGEKLISTIVRHQAAVTALQFNPHSGYQHWLASGGADQEVGMVTLDRPGEPSVFSPTEEGHHHLIIVTVTTIATIRHRRHHHRCHHHCHYHHRRPSSGGRHTGEVSCVAWNTQVPYILAAGGQDGNTIIWDLSKKKRLYELKDPYRNPVSSVAWNPAEVGEISALIFLAALLFLTELALPALTFLTKLLIMTVHFLLY